MQNKNFGMRDFKLDSELKISMHNQIDANSGINRPKPGVYEIVLVYAEPLIDKNPLKLDKNDKDGVSISDSSSFIARMVLQGEKDQTAFLALPCDEYSIDLFNELIGKKVISNGEFFCIYGDSCDPKANSIDAEKDNLISPFFMNSAVRRHDFFNGLGMLRSEFLLKNQEYKIESAFLSDGINQLNRVPRKFIEVKLTPQAGKDSTSENALSLSDPINLRVYFNKTEEALLQRTLNFFLLRCGRAFTPKEQIPTMTKPINIISFLQQFIPGNEEPIMRVGKVYAIDYAGEKNESEAYVVFHDIAINQQVEECDKSILTIPGVKIATIKGFSKNDEDGEQSSKQMEGRTVSDIVQAFNPRKEDAPKRLFSVSENIYDGMLDYINFKQMRIGLELFNFNDAALKEDEIKRMSSMSFARNWLRSGAIRQHLDAGIE